MAEVVGLAFVGMAPLRLIGIYLHSAHEISDTTPASTALSTGFIVVLLHGLSRHHEPDTLSEDSTASRPQLSSHTAVGRLNRPGGRAELRDPPPPWPEVGMSDVLSEHADAWECANKAERAEGTPCACVPGAAAMKSKPRVPRPKTAKRTELRRASQQAARRLARGAAERE